MSDSQKRTKTGQAKHDKKVLQRLNLYKEKHFSVKADLPGRAKPPKIGGRIPDIIAKKGKKLIVEEIETPSTKTTDKIQHDKLKEGTKKLGGKFKVIIAK
ncbi:MAG: hypothetical protein Q8O59_01665 [bacterium]|nr:hypothetical protein [bacterium]